MTAKVDLLQFVGMQDLSRPYHVNVDTPPLTGSAKRTVEGGTTAVPDATWNADYTGAVDNGQLSLGGTWIGYLSTIDNDSNAVGVGDYNPGFFATFDSDSSGRSVPTPRDLGPLAHRSWSGHYQMVPHPLARAGRRSRSFPLLQDGTGYFGIITDVVVEDPGTAAAIVIDEIEYPISTGVVIHPVGAGLGSKWESKFDSAEGQVFPTLTISGAEVGSQQAWIAPKAPAFELPSVAKAVIGALGDQEAVIRFYPGSVSLELPGSGLSLGAPRDESGEFVFSLDTDGDGEEDYGLTGSAFLQNQSNGDVLELSITAATGGLGFLSGTYELERL